jgi:hypothetical protein
VGRGKRMKVKVYEKKSDKVIDFLIGFILVPAVFFAGGQLVNGTSLINSNPYFLLVVFIAASAGVVYLCQKRKFIGIGIGYLFILIPLAALGTCFLIGTGMWNGKI